MIRLLIDDYRKRQFKYEIYLCKSSSPYEIIGCLTNSSTDRKFKWQLKNVDEMSFIIHEKFEDGTLNDLFDKIYKTNVIRVEKWIDDTMEEVFLYSIDDIIISSGDHIYKEVKAYSLEVRLNGQLIRNFPPSDYDGGFQLYTGKWDVNDLPNSGMVDYILSLSKGQWKAGYITVPLMSQIRYINIPSAKVLDAIKTIENNYNCIFIFHTALQIIDIVEHGDPYYSLGLNANTGLILDHQNYIDQYKSQLNTDDIITRLYARGTDETDISSVNILGTEYIDNFGFFMKPQYMSTPLIDRLEYIENLITTETPNYTALLDTLSVKRTELSVLNNELADLETDLIILENSQDISVKTGLSYNGNTYAQWGVLITAKKGAITSKEAEITSKEAEITSVNNQLSSLSYSVSYEANLTEELQQELVNFIREGEQQFETDDPSVLLYLARGYLDINSQSSYDIQVDMVDIFGINAESYVWNKIKLGHKVNLIVPYE
jgi:hypothetical protein